MKSHNPPPFFIGQRVRPSGSSLRPLRDAWLLAGAEPAKSRAKDELDRKAAERGTVQACERGRYGWGVKVITDAGSVHDSMPYLWDVALMLPASSISN